MSQMPTAPIVDGEPPSSSPGPQPLHPYDEWFDGQTRALTPGVHFECDYETFRNRIYAAARRRGLRASVWMDDQGEVLLFVREPSVQTLPQTP